MEMSLVPCEVPSWPVLAVAAALLLCFVFTMVDEGKVHLPSRHQMNVDGGSVSLFM